MIRQIILSSSRTDKKKPDSPNNEADKTGPTVAIAAEDIPFGDKSPASKTLRAFHHDRSDNDASTAATKTSTKRSVAINRNTTENVIQICRRKLWDQRCNELVAYLEEHKVWPNRSDQKSKSLNQWLHTQRQSFKNKNLSDDKKNQLDNLGFAWEGAIGSVPFHRRGSQSHNDSGIDGSTDNGQDGQHKNNPVVDFDELCGRTVWDHRYSELVAYLEEHKVWPDRSTPQFKLLYEWLRRQRKSFRQGELCFDEQKQLTDLGFWWKGRFGGMPYRPHNSQLQTRTQTKQGRSKEAIQDTQEPADNMKDNSDNRHRDDDNSENSCDGLNNEESDYHDDEKSDYYGDEESDYYDDDKSIDDCYNQTNKNNNDKEDGEEEGISHKNFDSDDAKDWDAEKGRDELNGTEHESDNDSNNPSSCSDIMYDHQHDKDDEDDKEEYEEEYKYAAKKKQKLHNIERDTIVADRIESSSLPFRQRDTIRTTVARLPSGDEEDHQTTPGLSGVESMSLWVANQKIHLRRVSEEELRQLRRAGLPNIPTMGGGVDRQDDVGDGDDRKMAATVVGDGIFDDAPEDDKIVTTNPPTAVEHEVRQESDWCGSSSCGSQQEAWDGDDDDDGDDDIDFEV